MGRAHLRINKLRVNVTFGGKCQICAQQNAVGASVSFRHISSSSCVTFRIEENKLKCVDTCMSFKYRSGARFNID